MIDLFLGAGLLSIWVSALAEYAGAAAVAGAFEWAAAVAAAVVGLSVICTAFQGVVKIKK